MQKKPFSPILAAVAGFALIAAGALNVNPALAAKPTPKPSATSQGVNKSAEVKATPEPKATNSAADSSAKKDQAVSATETDKTPPGKSETKAPAANTPAAPEQSQKNSPATPEQSPKNNQSSTTTGTDTTAKPKTETKVPVTKTTSTTKSPFIVRFVEGTVVNNEIAELAKSKINVSRKFGYVFKGLVAELTQGQKLSLEKRPSVLSVEADSIVSIDENQDLAPWGLDRIDQQDLPLETKYGYTSAGLGVSAYVVDTGIRSTHQEFGNRVSAGFTAINDAVLTGDCNGHGTHVASTLGGTSYGVAKAVTLVPVRVLDCAGSGTTSGVIAGLDWIAQNHPANVPGVVNMSLGGGANSSLDSAVSALISRGITVVVAAGNSTDDACKYSPARTSAAITVGATTSADQFASYSNFGSCVDISAPGTAISGAWIGSDSDSRTISGTSMATPHVAGVVARILSISNQLPSAVANTLISSGSKDKLTALPAATPNLLLFRSSTDSDTQLPKAPNPAGQLSAIGGVKQATISWQLGDNSANPLTSLVVKLWLNGQLVKTFNLDPTANKYTATKLRASKGYYFTVVSVSSGGSAESAKSESVTVTNR